jgi:homoserine O-acetyltransferase/O-succinyltransferase
MFLSAFRLSQRVSRTTARRFYEYHTLQAPRATKSTPCYQSDALKDEYGEMTDSGEICTFHNVVLEHGGLLPKVDVCYNSYGQLNEAKDNCMIVCHALTGNSQLDGWWGDMLGPGKSFDTDKYFVVCANVLGSCYGSTGPKSIDPTTNKPYGMSFPECTIRDTVNVHMRMLKEHLGVKSVHCVLGGSLGGMQALEWTIMGGDFIKNAVLIGCGSSHTAWQIAISEAQRQAIYADPKWNDGNVDMEDPPNKGLAVARQMAMIWYRSSTSYAGKFGRKHLPEEKENTVAAGGVTNPLGYKVPRDKVYKVQTYLEYQGYKFKDRFDPVTYIKVTEQMDSHDIGRGRGEDIPAVLQGISTNCLVVGIKSDILYPLHEQNELATNIPNADFEVIEGEDGHDAFLLEQEQLAGFIKKFLNK